MVAKMVLTCSGILIAICLSFSLASGQMSTEKKAVVLPQGVDEKAVLDVCLKEGENLKYDLKQEGNKYVLQKIYSPHTGMGHKEYLYRITVAISSGLDGRRTLMLETEYLGDAGNPGWFSPNLRVDVTKIEDAVKSYLATK
jgi:hypothetical protein